LFIQLKKKFGARIAPYLPKGFADIEPRTIIALAERATGLHSWGDPSFLEPLERLVHFFKREVPQTYSSRIALRAFLVQMACTRLRVIDVLEKNPEISQVPIRRPLFVAGYPRTGTTLLQNLLALDPDAKSLRCWEAQMPVPPPDPATYSTDPRIRIATDAMNAFYRRYPIWERIHKLYPEGPQECEGLFALDFACTMYYARYPVPGYLEYLLARDMGPSYRFYRRQLQLLSWKFPGKRWLLKAPMHLTFLRSLIRAFPDASVVITHRAPVAVFGSICSMISSTRELSNVPEGRDKIQLGRHVLSFMPGIMDRYLDLRRESDSRSFLDVDYRDIVNDPVGQVRRIYETFQYPWPDGYDDRMREFLAGQRRDRFGAHVYSTTDFGLTPEEIEVAFQRYKDAFPQFFH
jgi:hypothetical protein